MSNKIIRNLKTLFKTFIYYRDEDFNNFKQWFDNNVTYTNGGLENKSYQSQEINLNFDVAIVSPRYRGGMFYITLNPGVVGQIVTVKAVTTGSGQPTTHTLTTDNNGKCVLSQAFFRNYSATITAEPINVDGVYYEGGNTSYQF